MIDWLALLKDAATEFPQIIDFLKTKHPTLDLSPLGQDNQAMEDAAAEAEKRITK